MDIVQIEYLGEREMEWHNFTNDERQQIGRPNHWSSFDLFGLIPVYSRAATVVRTYTLFYGFA